LFGVTGVHLTAESRRTCCQRASEFFTLTTHKFPCDCHKVILALWFLLRRRTGKIYLIEVDIFVHFSSPHCSLSTFRCRCPINSETYPMLMNFTISSLKSQRSCKCEA